MEKVDIDVRYSVPSKYDSAPYATIIKVVTGLGKDNETYCFYIQSCKDDKKPNWIQMGMFLEEALEELFSDKAFIDEAILMYHMAQIRKKSVFRRS